MRLHFLRCISFNYNAIYSIGAIDILFIYFFLVIRIYIVNLSFNFFFCYSLFNGNHLSFPCCSQSQRHRLGIISFLHTQYVAHKNTNFSIRFLYCFVFFSLIIYKYQKNNRKINSNCPISFSHINYCLFVVISETKKLS